MFAFASASYIVLATHRPVSMVVSSAASVVSYTSVSQYSLPAVAAAGNDSAGVQPYSCVAMMDTADHALALFCRALENAGNPVEQKFCVSGATIFTVDPANAGPSVPPTNVAMVDGV